MYETGTKQNVKKKCQKTNWKTHAHKWNLKYLVWHITRPNFCPSAFLIENSSCFRWAVHVTVTNETDHYKMVLCVWYIDFLKAMKWLDQLFWQICIRMVSEQAERVADLNRGQLYLTVESRLLDCQQHTFMITYNANCFYKKNYWLNLFPYLFS